MTDQVLLQYVSYNSFINPSFWYKLSQVKLDIDKLSEDRKHIWGFYSNVTTQYNATLLEIDCTSFNMLYEQQKMCLPAHGFLLNKNTIEQFKTCNKLELIDEEGLHFWNIIKNGSVLEDPSLLNTFFILSFADFKKYHYYYWFAFPTPININVVLNEKPKPIVQAFSDEQITNLSELYNSIKDIRQKTFFIIEKQNDKVNIVALNSVIYKNCQDINVSNYEELYFSFSDPCMSGNHPGWPLRNFLAMLMHYCHKLHGKVINVVSFRLQYNRTHFDCKNSIIFNIKLPETCGDFEQTLQKKCENDKSFWVGWEKNERSKYGPRMANMSLNMDPVILADNSIDLNLKLMKWRLLPNIDLEKLKITKCLLLGSGTLGCSVARTLLAWGVRHISLVDNSKVSYSNPVRQSLFTHEDCLNGGKLKAIAAAENLKKIFPAVCSVGYQINIPMPGHSVGECLLNETKKNVDLITELISKHDVIFLLMDSRESRWLPTLLAAFFGKIVINAALGFDTYLVMRHGCTLDTNFTIDPEIIPEGFRAIPGDKLGCYFCNDITAPGNSLKDRTLDQQCTVTRPGISAIAGSIAVELAVSILQHKNGPYASAFYKTANNDPDIDAPTDCLLGILPHSIRGFLSSFTNVLPATERFKNCVACSDVILKEYETSGFQFLLQVFNSSKYLEDLTGLTELYKETNMSEIWEISDSDIDEDEYTVKIKN